MAVATADVAVSLVTDAIVELDVAVANEELPVPLWVLAESPADSLPDAVQFPLDVTSFPIELCPEAQPVSVTTIHHRLIDFMAPYHASCHDIGTRVSAGYRTTVASASSRTVTNPLVEALRQGWFWGAGSVKSARVTAASAHFYRDLPEVLSFADVVDEANYTPVPVDWDIVMTDIRGSTRAIEAGLYRHVNALGAAGIIALRNALPDVELPFVFGGDGATILTPSTSRTTVRATLRGLQELARTAFDLDLRCGVIAVEHLYAQGHQLKLARFRGSPHITLAMLAGSALAQAETTIKQDDSSPISVPLSPVAQCDLSGFECRWQPIKSTHGLTLALMVTALGNDVSRQQTYRKVLNDLEQLARTANPIPVSRKSLKLMGPFGDYHVEGRIRSATKQGPRFDQAVRFARKATTVGQALMFTKTTGFGFDGAAYPAEVLQNCDYRKFDNTLRMILDLSPNDYTQLRATLEQYRSQGLIAFGAHTSTSALLTCYVRSFEGDHVHFVDAAEGGYAVAAKELKGQLKTNSRYPALHIR